MSQKSCWLFVALGISLALTPCGRGETEIVSLETWPQAAESGLALFKAAATGDVPALQKALADGIPANVVIPHPAPPELAALIPAGSLGAMVLNQTGGTALMLAAAGGKAQAIEALIAARANVEARTKAGYRPLDLAAMRNDVDAMQRLIGVTPESEARHLSILVDLPRQRATLSRDGTPVLTTKISSGKKGKPTPPGIYVVTQKYPEWRSTLYHNASMPFFLRLSCGSVGLHQGVVLDHPASHGCVRLPEAMAKKFYAIVPRGTVVEIRGDQPAEAKN